MRLSRKENSLLALVHPWFPWTRIIDLFAVDVCFRDGACSNGTRSLLVPGVLLFGREKSFSTGEAKIWEPFRSIFEQWTQVKGEEAWVEIVMPRDPRTKMQSRMNRASSPSATKIVYGVRCTRPRPRIRREMVDDFRRRTLNLVVKY